MKKLIIALILFWAATSAVAQNRYTFNWSWYELYPTTSDKRQIRLRVRLQNGSTYTILNNPTARSGRQVLNYTSPIVSANAYVWRNPGFTSNSSDAYCSTSRNYTYNDASCGLANQNLSCYSGNNNNQYKIRLNFSIRPVDFNEQNIAPTCYRDEVRVDANARCRNLQVNRWYYYLPNDTYRRTLGTNGEFNGREVITFNLDEKIPNIENYIGQSIVLEATYNNSSSIRRQFPIEIINCTPELTNIVPIATRCSDDETGGGFYTYLANSIGQNDELNFNLFEVTQGNNPDDSGYQEIQIANYSATRSEIYTYFDYPNMTLVNYFKWPFDVSAGKYRVQYQLNNYGTLISSDVFTISAPTPVTFTGYAYPFSCGDSSQGDVSDGRIRLQGYGGTGTYQYRINDGNWTNFPSNSMLLYLAAGTYDVEIRDSNQCIGTPIYSYMSTLTIEQPDPITILEEDIGMVTSYGNNNGYINAKITGGRFPGGNLRRFFRWEHDSGGSIPEPTITKEGDEISMNLSGLIAGTYTLFVTDRNDCATSREFVITQPEPLVYNQPATITHIDCYGRDNGSISISASGGVPNYRFTLLKRNTSSNGFVATGDELYTDDLSTATFTVDNLGPGEYRVQLSDNVQNSNHNNLVFSSIYTINEATPIEYTITNTTDVSCHGGNDGTARVTVSGGSGNYLFAWRKNGEDVYSTVQNPNNLKAGIYTLTVMDENVEGCTAINPVSESEIVINEPEAALTISLIDANAPTGGSNNGSIHIQGQGGTPPYTYAWNTGQTTTQINNLSAGTYIVTLTDTNGCSTNRTFILDELAVTIAVVPGEEITCNGGRTTLFATATGGDNQYTYAWFNQNNPSTSIGSGATINNIADGAYYVTVTDGYGTAITSSVLHISSPAAVVISNVINTAINCFGGNDGSITINANGGTGALQYSIDNGASFQSSNTFNNLTEGAYQIMVKDTNNCTSDAQGHSIIAPETPLTISAEETTNVTIYGEATGSIDVTVSGGNTNGYFYAWTGPNGYTASTEDIDNIRAGTYTLIVEDAGYATATDNAACTLSRTFTITQPDQLEVVVDYETPETTLACHDSDTARLFAFATGGVAPYAYQWSKQNETGTFDTLNDTSALIIGVDAGTYQVTITDVNGAITNGIFEVIAPNPISAAFTVTPVRCFDENTGAINLVTSGGTPPYTYAWSDGNSTENLTDIAQGSYSVTITDTNGCSFSIDEIVITQPDSALAITDATVTHLTGYNENNGSITLTVAGGTPNYTYTWRLEGTTTSIGSSNTIAGLAAGNYEVTIIDANNCITTEVYEITQPEALTITIDYPQVGGRILCNGTATAILEASVTGGVPFLQNTPQAYYQYQWINISNSSNSIGTAATLQNIGAGTYQVVVTDANGNTATPNQNFVVTEPDAMDIMVSAQQNPLCFNGTDGTISVHVTGGTLLQNQEYTYSWSDGQTTNPATGLAAGTYQVTVFDSNGCQYTSAAITLQQPDPLAIENIDLTPPTSNTATDGSVTITMTGGTPPYNYQWFDSNSNVLSSTSQTLDYIGGGEYFVTVTDAQGCQIIRQSILQTAPDPIRVSLEQINEVLCYGDGNASIRAVVTGGTPPYTYQWFDNTQNPMGTDPVIDGVSGGIYYVMVTDANNNTVQSANITVDAPEQLQTTLTTDYINCGEANDWILQSTTTGGTPPYTYLWNNGLGTTDTLVNMLPGTYFLTVQDSRGCSTTERVIITAPQALVIDNVTLVNPSCFDGANGSITISLIGGAPPYTYNWNDGQSTATASELNAGIHTVEIIDSKGCAIVAQYELEDPEELIIDLGEDQTLCIGQSQILDATIADPLATYQWIADNGFTATTALISVTETGSYTVSVTTGLGCILTDTVQITALDQEINPSFLVATDLFVGQSFVIIEESNPLPDDVEWILPETAQVIETTYEYAELQFDAPGEYQIGLQISVGACTAFFERTIVVREPVFDPDAEDTIKLNEFKVYPNPADVNFDVDITFEAPLDIDLQLFKMTNNMLEKQITAQNAAQYLINFDISALSTGMYYLLLQANGKSYIRKVVVK